MMITRRLLSEGEEGEFGMNGDLAAHDSFAMNLGKIHGNLLSLEFCLRCYLHAIDDHPRATLDDGMSFDSLKVDDEVPETALTDYRTLGELVDRYNSLIKPAHPDLTIDRTLVDLRDALAHGRVSGANPSFDDLTLVKFAKPKDGRTRVTYSQRLTTQWLKEQNALVLAQVKKVYTAPGFPSAAGT